MLCMVLAALYMSALALSVRLQCKLFNLNRFLEMSYYLISYFFACTPYLARMLFCISLAYISNTYLIVFLRFNPDVFEVTIGSMVAYLW